LFTAGIGQGLAVNSLFRLVLSEIPPDDAGAVAGVLLTVTQVATALGVAVTGLIFTAAASSDFSDIARVDRAVDLVIGALTAVTALGLLSVRRLAPSPR
jgi:hypothetical protein